MRRIIVAVILSLTILAGCSPYMSEAEAATPPPSKPVPTCGKACIEVHRTYQYAAAVEAARIQRLYAFAAAVERARIERTYAFAAAVEAARLNRIAAAQAAASNTVWDRLARCESGGNWAINTGNGYYGGLQFSARSWRAVGGQGLPHHASRETQIAMGERLRRIQGWGAWPSCSRRLGLR